MGVRDLQVSSIRGVGPKKQAFLQSMGINVIEDLLYYFPRAYEDRTEYYALAYLPHGVRAGVRAMITGPAVEKGVSRKLSITKVPIQDNSGKGWVVWFNNPYAAKKLSIGNVYDFFGKIDRKYEIQVQNPDVEQAGNTRKIVPIYSKSRKLTSRDFEKLIRSALEMTRGNIDDIFPEQVRAFFKLEDINFCINNIHFPENFKSLQKARRRLVFEELFLFQLGLLMIKTNIKNNDEGIVLSDKPVEKLFLERLPFKLTTAQKRAYCEIKRDMESCNPMNRLLQGDVGSGKTVVALMALLKAAANGYQGALMVPTEILAEQHYSTIKGFLKDFDFNVELLVGSCSSKEKDMLYSALKEGNVDIIIGTHALIQESLEFSNLGLVVTDEQHRFGVRQRAALFGKGKNPDVLIMTATPIPRTLALILYGDMDISIIDQMPPGRKKIETYAVEKGLKNRVYKFVKKQISEGRQAYVVCPLIEESEMVDAVSAVQVYEELVNNHLKGFKVELIHGKLTGLRKEQIMRDFRDRKIDVLISTTVVEVGVNVINANVMVIENAERFGLAQLHQLRGRVGRGNYQSYCILINDGKSEITRRRMKIMTTTNDGFKIAEKDLNLRGPGDFFGTRQHGLPDLKIASLPEDMEILKEAQQLAIEVVGQPDFRNNPKWRLALEKVNKIFKENYLPAGTI